MELILGGGMTVAYYLEMGKEAWQGLREIPILSQVQSGIDRFLVAAYFSGET